MPAATPAQLDELYATYVNAGDLDGIVSLFETDALLTRPGRQVTGIEAIRVEFAANLRRIAAGRRLYPVSVRVQSTDGLALLRTIWRVEETEPTGQKVERESVTCEVGRLQADGTWKFVIDDPLVMTESR
jgi:uncharacterized protein (TIGR02246 family)